MQEVINYFENILKFISENKFSDLHINTGEKIMIRNKIWEIEEMQNFFWFENKIFEKKEIENFIKIIIWEENFPYFLEEKEFDISYKISSDTRFRVNCFIDSNWYSIAIRTISSKIPTLEELWFWETIKELCRKDKWLILLTWPTWSWKSTNIASMIDYLNKNFKKRIITIEDPIEFSFKSDKSLVSQREIWAHTNSFEKAIKSSLREDPDIIVIWEMRDTETIKSAITLAETWHIVFSSLHTNDAVQTIDRIVDVFPSSQQAQIRMQLSQSLIWIISQKLLPRADSKWKIASREILIADDAVKNLIISGKTHQLYSVLEVSKDKWMILMDKYLLLLYEKWFISKEILFAYCRNKEDIELMI